MCTHRNRGKEREGGRAGSVWLRVGVRCATRLGGLFVPCFTGNMRQKRNEGPDRSYFTSAQERTRCRRRKKVSGTEREREGGEGKDKRGENKKSHIPLLAGPTICAKSSTPARRNRGHTLMGRGRIGLAHRCVAGKEREGAIQHSVCM